jgi:hypothetical protein
MKCDVGPCIAGLFINSRSWPRSWFNEVLVRHEFSVHFGGIATLRLMKCDVKPCVAGPSVDSRPWPRSWGNEGLVRSSILGNCHPRPLSCLMKCDVEAVRSRMTTNHQCSTSAESVTHRRSSGVQSSSAPYVFIVRPLIFLCCCVCRRPLIAYDASPLSRPWIDVSQNETFI